MRTYFLVIISICIYSMTSCTKSDVDIEYCNPYDSNIGNTGNNGNAGNNGSPGQDNDNTGGSINFTAMVEGLNMTRSLTPIQPNTLASVFAYDSISNSLVASGNYISTSIGQLDGVNGYNMYLTGGIYNFYSVSTNSTIPVPTFTDFKSAPLSNGIDYLWWGVNNKTFSSTSPDINIIYTHRASQIVLNFSSKEGVTIDSLASVFTTAPEENETMSLKTGVITPSPNRQGGFVNQMKIENKVASSILLPAVNWNNIAVIIKAYINGKSTPTPFSAQLPIPNGTLIGGNSYQYSLVLSLDSVTVGSAEVADWKIIKDSTPIYPSEW